MPSIQLTGLTGRYLSFAEREDIAIWRAQQIGVREIARRLGRSPSTISREVRRNAATRSGRLDYRAGVAQWKAELLARRPKTAKLVDNERLHAYVQERLSGVLRTSDGALVAGPPVRPWKGLHQARRQDRRWMTAWSPEQIARRLPLDHPDDESMRISHEARSIRLFTSRAAARSNASWSPVCAPDERSAFRRPGRAAKQPGTSHPRS